jgi:hypothetical protein
MTALSSVLGTNAGVVDSAYFLLGYAPRAFASLDQVGQESGNSSDMAAFITWHPLSQAGPQARSWAQV